MKHAYLIMAHNSPRVLSVLLSMLDDHLSANVNENAVYAMLDNWKNYYGKFHNDYDFNSNYAKWFYFSCICDVLQNCKNTYAKNRFNDILRNLFSNEIYNELLQKFSASGIKEKRYKKALKTRDFVKIEKAFSTKSKMFNKIDQITRKIGFKLKGIKF